MASASYDTSGSGRLLPQSLDSERSVLGSMFRSNDVIGDVVQILNVDNFYSDAHQKIYKAMIVLYEAGKPVDLVVLTEALKLANQIDDVGGYGALAELWDAAPTAANAVHYAHMFAIVRLCDPSLMLVMKSFGMLMIKLGQLMNCCIKPQEKCLMLLSAV